MSNLTTPLTRKENARKLAEGYTMQKRICEMVCITTFTGLFVYEFIRTGRFLKHSPDAPTNASYTMVPSVFVAMLLADFFSGIAHWGFDTWGTPEYPVFGTLIRSFREHHADQSAMTKHDFIETNGDNFMACIPVIALYALAPIHSRGVLGANAHAFVLTLTLLVAFTNQTHKMAHQSKQVPFVRLLMDNRLMLSPQAHRVHHSGIFDKGYCITTGWLNPFLDGINFWRHAETVVTALTGAIPRANDTVTLNGEEVPVSQLNKTDLQ